MPRIARITIPEAPHHITQRGNNRQDVFFADDDRQVYLSLLQRQAERYGLDVLGYCLVANHVHLVAIPRQADSLAKAIGRTHLLYAQYINRMHGRTGHLWQGRFLSCALDEEHCWAALSYVERNPVRAGAVRCAWKYPWSSAAAHCAGADATGLLHLKPWRKAWEPRQWRQQLRRRGDDELTDRLRLATRSGRPLGSNSFLSKIERAVGHRLRPLPVGRPRTRPTRRHPTEPKRPST